MDDPSGKFQFHEQFKFCDFHKNCARNFVRDPSFRNGFELILHDALMTNIVLVNENNTKSEYHNITTHISSSAAKTVEDGEGNDKKPSSILKEILTSSNMPTNMDLMKKLGILNNTIDSIGTSVLSFDVSSGDVVLTKKV